MSVRNKITDRKKKVRRNEIAVFLGPSLERNLANSILPATYYPPARQGDVYRIIPSGVKKIVLIDGVFHGTRSVWQRELLDAMQQGIAVIGASSMGALRAAELRDLGMLGYGTVFQWYRDGHIDGDDEVALLHGPEELQFCPLSEPLVNIRYTLKRCMRSRCILQEEADELIRYAKSLCFTDRSYQGLLQSPLSKSWKPERWNRFRIYLRDKRVDIKRRDAIRVLRYCRKRKFRQRFVPDGSICKPSWWERERCNQTGFFTNGQAVTGQQLLEYTMEEGDRFRTSRKELVTRYLIQEWARLRNISCPASFEREFEEQWRSRHIGKLSPSWLRANGLTRAMYKALLKERALVDWILEKGPAAFGAKGSIILDWAALSGISDSDRTGEHLEDWILEKGPKYFGLTWSQETAFFRQLQIRGDAQRIAEKFKKL